MFNYTRLTFAGLRTISAAPTKPPPRLAHANHSAKVDVAPTKAAAKPKVLCLLIAMSMTCMQAAARSDAPARAPPVLTMTPDMAGVQCNQRISRPCMQSRRIARHRPCPAA